MRMLELHIKLLLSLVAWLQAVILFHGNENRALINLDIFCGDTISDTLC